MGEKPRLRQELFPEEVIMSQDPEVKKSAEDSSGERDTLGTREASTAGGTKCGKEQPGIRRGELGLGESSPLPVSNKELLEASLEGSGET